jgi:hypothetical protein
MTEAMSAAILSLEQPDIYKKGLDGLRMSHFRQQIKGDILVEQKTSTPSPF